MSSAGQNTTYPTGSEGCRCIDTSAVLASLVERSCTTSDDQKGVLLAVDGPCVNYDYGSSSCLPHDIDNDPQCQAPESSNSTIPKYCSHSWCYVNAMECMATSKRVYRSLYFKANSGVDIFYSYNTCDSSPTDWFDRPHVALEGISMTAIVPKYNLMPNVFKRDFNGDVPPIPGGEYYDNSVPHEGAHINFVKSLEGIADGDFDVNYVHGSRASLLLHPSSPGTAAVQDVADGLVDIVIGPIWITGGRLKMTSFTMPIQHDKTVLVIPKPGSSSPLFEQTRKVLDPFEIAVWGLLLGVIAVTALLSVWFSEKRSRQTKTGRARKKVYARLLVDEFLQKGIFFCSAGVEQEEGASLPHKLLMFGFGFFILIVVSAYVANLAAFLTRPTTSTYVGNIEDVIAKKMRICAHPALQDDLELAHPDANFVFNQEGKELYGLVEDYDADLCQVMAVGKMDSLGDLKLMDLFCEKKLVYTDSLIIENPVGFPIRPELASGFSYWMYQGEKYSGISVEAEVEKYNRENKRQPSCNVIMSEQDAEPSEYAQIMVGNLIFPIMFFLGFAVLAIILQLYHYRVMRKAKDNPRGAALTSLVGRNSNLNLFKSTRNVGKSFEVKYDDDDDADEEKEEDCGIQSAQVENIGSSIGKGTMIWDSVHLDDFHDNGENPSSKKKVSFTLDDNIPSSKKKVSFTLDANSPDSGVLPTGEDEESQLDTGMMDKLDEFIHCYQAMKKRKNRLTK